MSNRTGHIDRFRRDGAAYRSSLRVDGAGGPVAFVPDDWQRADFEAMDPAWQRVLGFEGGPVVSRALLMRGRGHSKTADAAMMALRAVALSERHVSGLTVAPTREQANLVLGAMESLARLNGLLGAIDVHRESIRNPRTGSEIVTISGEALSGFGRVPHFVICDEWTHILDEAVWQGVLTTAGKREDCLLQVCSNSGRVRTWQHRFWEAAQRDPRWYVSTLPGPVASWIPQSLIDEQRAHLPAAVFDRYIGNRWVDGTGAEAIPAADIERAAVLGGPCGPEPGWTYCGGADIAVRGHAAAFAVVGKLAAVRRTSREPERVLSLVDRARLDLGLMEEPESVEEFEPYTGPPRFKLVHLRAWTPSAGNEVDLSAVGRSIVEAHRRYGLREVLADPYEMELMRQRLQRAGVPMRELRFTPANMSALANTLVETFSSGSIEIPNDPALVDDLQALRISETPGGWKLDPPRTASGHGDRAIAAALAIFAAARHSAPYESRRRLTFAGQFPADDFDEYPRGSIAGAFT